MVDPTLTALLVSAQKLSDELVELGLSHEVTRGDGWLIVSYLGYQLGSFDSAVPCPKLTRFLANKYHSIMGEFSDLPVDEWLRLLSDAEALYPKYRA